MSENTVKPLQNLISEKGLQEIDLWIKKYPPEQKQSAVLSALRIVQEEHGVLTEALMNAVAHYLEMPNIAVYEVATFYTMFELKPTGQHVFNVCTNISCKLKGSANIVAHLEKKLGISLGQTTADGRYTLRSVECLGACANAPMMQLGKEYHEDLTPEKIDAVLEQCS